MEDLTIKEIHMKNGKIAVCFNESSSTVLFAKEAINFFRELKGTNFVTMGFIDPDTGEKYSLIIQREAGKPVAVVLEELRAEIRELKAGRGDK